VISKKRKSPVRHKVKAHTRKGNLVRTHLRGSNQPKSSTIKKRINQVIDFKHLRSVETQNRDGFESVWDYLESADGYKLREMKRNEISKFVGLRPGEKSPTEFGIEYYIGIHPKKKPVVLIYNPLG
jgi:hypothetical protein